MESLQEMLIRHEGIRLKPYKDSVGKLTIGIGRNLDDVGISNAEALYMLNNDVTKATIACHEHMDFFSTLNDVRQNVLIDMAFNLGIDGLMKFKNTLLAVKEGRYEDAAHGMLNSLWARQVGSRATELAEMMRTGEVTT